MKYLLNFIARIVTLNLSSKIIIMAISDILLLQFAILLSFYLRLGDFILPNTTELLLVYLIPFLIFPIFYSFSIYKEVIRYFGIKFIIQLFQSVSLYALLWGIIVVMIGIEAFPRSVVVINWVVSFLFLTSTRLFAKSFLNGIIDRIEINEKNINQKNILIYGAGIAGLQIANSLNHNKEYKLKGYLDDNPRLHNHLINSVPVYNPKKIKNIINKLDVLEMFIAIPSLSRTQRKKIINLANLNNLKVKILPSIKQIQKNDELEIDDLRNINVEDLLGRDQIDPDESLMNLNIKDKNVLVTGAGGSIGSEICRQIIEYSPRTIILYEINEYALFNLYNELSSYSIDSNIVPILGSTLNTTHLKSTIKKFNISTIYHTAAYKHVPIFEYNVIQGVYNNIFSTFNCINASIEENVETLVMISTDKAVRPSSFMGASKRFSEMLMQAAHIEKNFEKSSNTKFISVRFGNVLGSSGSVIPLFEEQIKKGGPITLTDKKIVRYFMTSKEASQLVIQAGAIGNGGEIFLLDMGKPVKIYELAKQMIHLSGLEERTEDNLDGDIEIKTIGLRPGEKLYEELLIEGNSSKTLHPRIYTANEKTLPWSEMLSFTNDINKYTEKYDLTKIIETLKFTIPEFKHDKNYDLID